MWPVVSRARLAGPACRRDAPGASEGGAVLDHVILGVADVERSRAFYERALAPLGMEVVMAMPGGAGFGANGKPVFWVAAREPSGPVHVAFSSADRAGVDAFHAAALAAGGRDNGAPGVRVHYHPSYYGAFVLDPDGNNVEAVCHRPAEETSR
jgi:catechol 2,3-dioxygenase-like lactoylglutathione lyase family enzyme